MQCRTIRDLIPQRIWFQEELSNVKCTLPRKYIDRMVDVSVGKDVPVIDNSGEPLCVGDSPILPPGASSQSWLFCPLISLGLVHAERARSVALYSTGSRTLLLALQHDFWMSCASDIVHMDGDYFQSLSHSFGVTTMLQSGWSGGVSTSHFFVKEQCTRLR